uniref:Band 7 domain-containing protein n=1 Tax=Aplanochytrium stocchinoi TaxID=215587 RepID=A0A7S3LR24_9STRA
MGSRAYECLREHALLCNDYMMKKGEDFNAIKPNTNHFKMILSKNIKQKQVISIGDGKLGKIKTGDGSFYFLAAGCHEFPLCQGYNVEKNQIDIKSTLSKDGYIQWGDRYIVWVKPGFVGFAERGEEVIVLPPGYHQWKDEKLEFKQFCNLSAPHVSIGPFSILSVDEGYSAITINNGKMDIKKGGNVYFLGHENHQFKTFVPLKVQITALDNRIKCATADNVVVQFEGSVSWKIEDVETAAENSVETMNWGGNSNRSLLSIIQQDVLEQTKASLSQFIGQVNYSDNFGVSSGKVSNIQPGVEVPDGTPVNSNDDAKYAEPDNSSTWVFDPEATENMVTRANILTARIGVTVYAINIVSVYPEDKLLQQSLAQGAVAAALAQKEETAARGKARADLITRREQAEALIIDANAQAKAIRIKAQADAVAKEERAKGALKAAELLSGNKLAQDLSRMEASVEALDNKKTFFFGANPGAVQSLLANPNIIKKDV